MPAKGSLHQTHVRHHKIENNIIELACTWLNRDTEKQRHIDWNTEMKLQVLKTKYKCVIKQRMNYFHSLRCIYAEFSAVSHKLQAISFRIKCVIIGNCCKNRGNFSNMSAFALFHHKMFNFIAYAIMESNAFAHVHRHTWNVLLCCHNYNMHTH